MIFLQLKISGTSGEIKPEETKKEVNLMKKIYTKPEISFESFKMTSSIATGCKLDKDEIPLPDMGYTIFIEGCEYVPVDGEFGICYDVPTDDTRVFGS
jgi:hypothetical protein